MLVPALMLPAAAVVRLAYFNVFGLVGGSYIGLSVDKNILVLSAVGMAQPYLGPLLFERLFALAMVLLAVMNVSPFKIPKQTGWVFAALIAMAGGFTAVYVARLP
jgi:CDP-diacylglycerol--serine O-phosphatidyltransferase